MKFPSLASSKTDYSQLTISFLVDPAHRIRGRTARSPSHKLGRFTGAASALSLLLLLLLLLLPALALLALLLPLAIRSSSSPPFVRPVGWVAVVSVGKVFVKDGMETLGAEKDASLEMLVVEKDSSSEVLGTEKDNSSEVLGAEKDGSSEVVEKSSSSSPPPLPLPY